MRLPSHARLTAGATGLAVAAVLITASPAAYADDPTDEADATAQLIDELAPEVVVAPESSAAGDLVAESGDLQVTMPSDSTGDVVLTDGDSPVAVGLPEVAGAATPVVADDGTVVYDADAAVDLAVQALDDGARVQTVLNDASAPLEYRYDFDGIRPVLLTDGSVKLVVSVNGRLEVDAGTIDKPWAVDANGTPVPTRYRVEGTTLVQEVDHTSGDFTYPIVADPSLSLGWYIYINYSAKDVQRYWSGSTFANQAAAAATCTLIGNAYGIGACSALTAGYFQSIGDTFKSAKSQNRGVQIALTYVGYIPVQWKVR